MTAYDASECVLHALFLMVLAWHPEAPLLAAVDNVGYGLHPRLKRALVSQLADWLLARGDRQLILTTHDPLVLDGLPLLDDRVRLFVVSRDGLGRVSLRRVVVDEALWQKKEERGWAMSDLWVEGWLGGVPDLL
jgi:predicted ATPase